MFNHKTQFRALSDTKDIDHLRASVMIRRSQCDMIEEVLGEPFRESSLWHVKLS